MFNSRELNTGWFNPEQLLDWLLPVSGLAAVTRLCPCRGAHGRVQNEWESFFFLSSNLKVAFKGVG